MILRHLRAPLIEHALRQITASHQPPAKFVQSFIVSDSKRRGNALKVGTNNARVVAAVTQFSTAVDQSRTLNAHRHLHFTTTIKILSPRSATSLVSTFRFLRNLQLRRRLRRIGHNRRPSSFLSPHRLSKLGHQRLHGTFQILSHIRDSLPNVIHQLPA